MVPDFIVVEKEEGEEKQNHHGDQCRQEVTVNLLLQDILVSFVLIYKNERPQKCSQSPSRKHRGEKCGSETSLSNKN